MQVGRGTHLGQLIVGQVRVTLAEVGMPVARLTEDEGGAKHEAQERRGVGRYHAQSGLGGTVAVPQAVPDLIRRVRGVLGGEAHD